MIRAHHSISQSVLLASIIAAAGLVIGGFLTGGIYESRTMRNAVVLRFNRFTGATCISFPDPENKYSCYRKGKFLEWTG
jgi:hypothetical protein